jgi:predicted dehydrogenase
MNKRTRRGFIKSSVIGGGAIMFPHLLPSRIRAAETAPNSQLTVGFVGMGKMSRSLLRQFLAHDARVLAVCDVDTTRREHAKAAVDQHDAQRRDRADASSTRPGCATYNNFEDLLAREDIDVVVIATPDHWHALVTLAALRAGKDVYCEKPLTHNIHEAREVMRAVPDNGRILQTGSMQRSSSEFRVACELVRNGVIGKVQSVDCSFGGPPVPCDLPEETMEPGLDWDRWVGPAASRPYNSILSPRGIHDRVPKWRRYLEFGGGAVADWGAHHLDIAQWGLGMDESGPVRVVKPPSPEDTRGAKLIFANGVPVTHVKGFGIDFKGTEGRVRVNRRKFVFERDGKMIASYTESPEDKETNLNQQVAIARDEYLADAKLRLHLSRDHVKDFMDSVRSRNPPIANEQVGGRTAICCHLVNMAYRHRQDIDWDPERMDFVRGSGDPAWLTRDYRSPWSV